MGLFQKTNEEKDFTEKAREILQRKFARATVDRWFENVYQVIVSPEEDLKLVVRDFDLSLNEHNYHYGVSLDAAYRNFKAGRNEEFILNELANTVLIGFSLYIFDHEIESCREAIKFYGDSYYGDSCYEEERKRFQERILKVERLREIVETGGKLQKPIEDFYG